MGLLVENLGVVAVNARNKFFGMRNHLVMGGFFNREVVGIVFLCMSHKVVNTISD